jgi:hypothetical protein
MARARVNPLSEVISIRKFAAHIGCVEGTVRGAIREGRLSKSVIRDETGKVSGVIWADAEAEWARNYSHGKHLLSSVAESLAEKPTGEAIRDINESRAISEHYKAELARIELEEKEKTVVSVDMVRSQLFNFANEVKVVLQGIPDVCVDDILSAEDRAEAHNIMKLAINKALLKLTEVVERDFS